MNDDKLELDHMSDTTSELGRTTNSDSDPGDESPRRLRRDKSVSFPDQLTEGGVSTIHSLEMVIDDKAHTIERGHDVDVDVDGDGEDNDSPSGGVSLIDDDSEDSDDSGEYESLAGRSRITKVSLVDPKDGSDRPDGQGPQSEDARKKVTRARARMISAVLSTNPSLAKNLDFGSMPSSSEPANAEE
jgi:hypothetical protein